MKRLVVIGIDGGTWTILDRCMSMGHMPYLKGLCEKGIKRKLRSVIPPWTPVAWASFQTGVGPGKHGVPGFTIHDIEDKKRMNVVNSSSIKSQTFYEILSDIGLETISISIPMTYPVRKIKGVMISGLLTPGIDSDFVYPGELKKEILDLGFKPFIRDEATILRDTNSKEMRSAAGNMISLLNSRLDLALHIAEKKKDWSLLCFQIQETDPIQHFTMKYMSEDYSVFDPKIRDYLYKEFYGEVDNTIKRLMEIDSDADLMIVSDHGFQSYKNLFYICKWLEDKNLLYRRRSIMAGLKRAVKRYDKINLRKLVGKNRRYLSQKIESGQIDMEKSRIVPIGMKGGTDCYCTLRILDKNLDFEDAKKMLLEMDNFGVIEKIIDGRELYGKDEIMPDIVIKCKQGFAINSSFDYGTETIRHYHDKYSGIHHEDGIFLACGNSINKTAISEESQLELIDICPIILRYFGIDSTDIMDGKQYDIFNSKTGRKWTRLESAISRIRI